MTLSFTDPIYLWALLLIPLALGLAALAPRSLPSLRRRLSLVLRTLVLALLVLALAGTQVRRPVDDLTVVFLVDVSDSMPPGARQEATEYVRAAIEGMPAGDKGAVVVFGKEALVERTASDLRRLDPLASVPVATRTNIADAIQLGLALLPGDSQKRLVLLSDGQENEGDARAAADLLAARDVVLDVLPLGGGVAGPEVQVTSLDAPDAVPLGQHFELSVRLDATEDTIIRLRVFGDNQLLFDQPVEVPAGGTTQRVIVEAGEEGFRHYRAVIEGEQDTRPQNNEVAAYTQVTGQPRVAVVTNEADEAAALVAALEAAQMSVEVLAANAVPQSITELVQYDTVVLVGVEAPELPAATIETLPTYVREWGHGLVMIGGPQGFGAGQWLRTPVEEALPVDMEVRPKDQEANVALVLAVDKSGSMGRCHCDDPNAGNYTPGMRTESGLPKVEIAKDAIVQATAALGQMDFVGVVAFDEAARWALETQRYPGLASLEQAIAPIDANGQTNIFAGLSEAEESLSGVDARVKHIILLTDGWSRAGDYKKLADQMAAEGITLSVVAAGAGSAQDLAQLAEAGGGAYYPAASMLDVPQIFLKETIRIAGRYIIEEPFYPTLMGSSNTILTGLNLNEVPLLLGYNGSTLKPDANEIMRTPQGDPLLATRRYGLGRTVAWTSDLSGRWADEWVEWEEFPTFVSQLVAWSFPDPQTGDLQLRTRQEGGATYLEVTSVDDDGRPVSADTRATIISSELETTELTVPQVGAGRYRAELPSDTIGAYLVNVTQSDENGEPIAQSRRGFVVPYSPEYRIQQTDETLLGQLASRTGGEIRTLEQPGEVFAHPPQQVTKAQDLWPWLLALALLLFPLDVAVRRVIFGRREWEAAREWIRERARRHSTPAPRTEPVLGSLLEAKERATRRESLVGGLPTRAERQRTVDDRPSIHPVVPPPVDKAPSTGGSEAEMDDGADEESSTFSRLRSAKRRARQ
ncbi:MAG: VWA domain-containing protein [Chloroflexota bacterium]|nr:VWA domain-containing protein [Chloroflexota bacterium]